MREKADHYFRQARRELDGRHRETLFDLAIDFATFARDLESWECSEVSEFVTPKSEKRTFLNIINFFGFAGIARSGTIRLSITGWSRVPIKYLGRKSLG
jgi:hypothetical protein